MGLMIHASAQVDDQDTKEELGDAAAASDRETVDCLLCGSGEFDTVVESPDYTTKLGGVFRVVRCRNCGLTFTNPRPTVAGIGRFYPRDYAPHEGHSWDESRRGRLRRCLERAVLRCDFNYPPQPTDRFTRARALLGRIWIRGSRRRAGWIPYRGQGRLLDFGCGAAQFARQMKECGWSVEGMDVSTAVAEKVERETGIAVHVGSLPHPNIRPGSFDAVTMWSSLEHVHDPRSVVRAAHHALSPGGILAVCVPNIESWSFRTFRQEWFGLELPRHLVHFSPDTLRELLYRHGFRLRTMRPIGRDGWLRRSARRAKHNGAQSRWLRPLDWKPLALGISRWTEWSGQAECIFALADKI